jgi:D-alanyl-D-alanine carboxypeptidase
VIVGGGSHDGSSWNGGWRMTAYNQAEWRATHQNGRIPPGELARIVPTDFDEDLQGPAVMHPEAAWNYQRMRDAASAAGVTLGISYSYRTFEKQAEKYAAYKAHTGNLAAEPGTSNHGWGTALDLNIPSYPAANSDPQFVWLKANGPRFGFHNNDAPSEPWHWDYEGGHPIEEDQMTPDEKAEFDAMKKTLADHGKLIEALRVGLGTEQDPAAFVWAGKRVAHSVRKTEETGKDGVDHDDDPG